MQSPEFLIIDFGISIRNLGNTIFSDKHRLKGNILMTHPHWDYLQRVALLKPFFEKEVIHNVSLPPHNDVGWKEILQGRISKAFIPVTMGKIICYYEF